MKNRSAWSLMAGIVLAFAACRKEDDGPAMPGPSGGPTPLAIALPSWVVDSIGPMPMPADDPLTVEGVALGRKLFYEVKLSDLQTISCASCHQQANAFADPRRFSMGTNGGAGTRNGMAIVNLGWSQNFFWDGRRHSFEEQAHDPVVDPLEMRNTWPVVEQRLQADPDYVARSNAAFGTTTIDSSLVLKALGQFQRTLLSFNSRFDRYYYGGDATALNAEEQAGMALFTGIGTCTACHALGLFTDDRMRNNGLENPLIDLGLGAVTHLATDNGKFKVPTLRNIAVTAPYMHDGRFNTLFDVVTFYGGHVQAGTPNLDHAMTPLLGIGNFTEMQKEQLIAFLNTLTDEAFLTDPALGQP